MFPALVAYFLLSTVVYAQEPVNYNSRRCVIKDKIEPRYNTCTSAYTILLRNTNISSLNLLNRIKTLHPDNMFYPVGSPSIEIYNNSELVWSPDFLNLTVATTISNGFLRLYINENSRLCIPETERKRLETVFNEETRIQKCTCVAQRRAKDGIPILSGDGECKIIDSDLIIAHFAHEQLDPETHRRLSQIEKINGRVIILNTSLTSLSFLERLISINSTKYPSLAIVDNEKLTRLGFHGLQRIHTWQNQRIMSAIEINYNRRLGLSGEEIAMLHNAVYLEKTSMKDIGGKEDPIKVYHLKVCVFDEPFVSTENYMQLELCIFVNGSIVINENTDVDEVYLHSAFQTIEFVNGCMTFNNTRYKDFDFFAHIRYVSCTKDHSAAITISHNQHLKRIGFSPKIVASLHGPAYRIHNNLLVPRLDIEVIKMLQINAVLLMQGSRTNFFHPNANYSFEYDNKELPHQKGDAEMARSWIMLSVAFIVSVIVLSIFEIIMYRKQRRAANDPNRSPQTTSRSFRRRRA